MKLSEFAQELLDYAARHEDAEITDYQCILQTQPHRGSCGEGMETLVFVTNPASLHQKVSS